MKSAFPRLRLVILCLWCFTACLFWKGPVQAGERGDYPAAGSMKGFADNLFHREDFYRAAVEYKRFLFYHPAHPYAPRALFNIATAAQLVADYPSALNYYRDFLSRFPHHPLAERASRAIVEIESTRAGR